MTEILKREVLRAFKSLHRARKLVFSEDVIALNESRKRINEEFKKHKGLNEMFAISELLQLAKSTEKELLTTVLQAKQICGNKYELMIRPNVINCDVTGLNINLKEHFEDAKQKYDQKQMKQTKISVHLSRNE